MIYPEAAWNVSPNQIVMRTFTGTVRLAQETGAEIVPIAMEQYGKTFYINIGENYRISSNATDDVDTLNSILREKLATLKWEIMERHAVYRRTDIRWNIIPCFMLRISME